MASSHLNSFLRESGKLYALYMVAGVAAIPAGLLYAILAVKGYGAWWSALLAIVLGFWMAKEAWSYVERRFFTRDFTASGVSITWPVPATAVMVVILSLPPVPSFPRPPIKSQQPSGAGTVVTMEQPEQTEEPVLTFEAGV